jgi:hypothetical protein
MGAASNSSKRLIGVHLQHKNFFAKSQNDTHSNYGEIVKNPDIGASVAGKSR